MHFIEAAIYSYLKKKSDDFAVNSSRYEAVCVYHFGGILYRRYVPSYRKGVQGY